MSRSQTQVMVAPSTEPNDTYRWSPLWTGPSIIIAVRTGKSVPFHSVLKTGHSQPSAIIKHNRIGPIHLGRLGFRGDETTYHEHGGPQKTVLQYNPGHYLSWREELKDVMMKDEKKRDSLLTPGGFGENITSRDPIDGPPMDERTVCVGDLVGIGKAGQNAETMVKIRITGPRQPCAKLNHRFGVKDMAQRAQNRVRTGWMYSTVEEGDIEVGSEMILLERPYPQWPIARIQWYLYSDLKNFSMIGEILDTLQTDLVADVKQVLENRFSKGVEEWGGRLTGETRISTHESFVPYKLSSRRKETPRISELVFERNEQLPKDDARFKIATPGSHIRLRFQLPGQDQMELIRPYSVINGDSNRFRLGIAFADKSRGGSSFLHQQLHIGHTVKVSENFANTFPLASEEDANHHLFLAGGIGITAFLDHFDHCVLNQKSFQLHYLVRNKSDAAFVSDINAILAKTGDRESRSTKTVRDLEICRNTDLDTGTDRSSQVTIYSSAEGNRCDVKALLSKVATDAKTHIYVCGSERLSNAVVESAQELDISGKRIHFEQFSVDASGDPFVAHLTRSKKQIRVAGDQTLLDALREAGMDVASSCEAGNCGTCKVRVICGKVIHRGTGLADDEKAGTGDEGEAGEMLSCISRGNGIIQLDL